MKKTLRKIIIGITLLLALAVLLSACSSKSTSSYSSNDDYEEFNEDVKDWMKDQAEDNDYDYDDGGTYYCMGKNDTCPNKTKNAYDLYCNSCDPDGDNVEG